MNSEPTVVAFEKKFMNDVTSLWRERFAGDYVEKRRTSPRLAHRGKSFRGRG